MKIKERLLDVLIEGILWSLYYWLLFAILLPWIVSRFMRGLIDGIKAIPISNLTGIIVVFVLLSLAATALKGTIYAPLINALESILGFAVVIYLLNGGIISASLSYGGPVTVTLDISPILMEIFLFFTVPGVVLPFIDYFLEERYS